MAGYGGTDNTSGDVLEGGGVFGADSGDIPARPADAPEATVGQWPPSSWGPKLYVIDESGNRVAADRPGTGP
jgi:hypothetical protein